MRGQPRDGDNLFVPVNTRRISEAVVDQVRALIRSKQLHPGDRLPSERKMCEQLRVARVTIREAMRFLEALGLIERRVGSHGGAFIVEASPADVADRLASLIRLAPLTETDLVESQLIFEVCIMPMLVQRATEQDVAELRALTQAHVHAAREGTYTSTMSAQFHNRFGACARNLAIEALMCSFHGPLRTSARDVRTAPRTLNPRGAVEHREIVEAVAVGDTVTASTIMRRHIARKARTASRHRRT